jgi:multidrug efflux pump subunit AcrA (membrane-fusion protein)
VKGAQAELESIRALLTSWGANSGGSVSAQLPIRSPISGFVAKRTATLGGAVRPDETLFHVVAPDRIVVLARWPEARLAVPERGSLLEVRPRTSSGSAECMARVETRGQIVDPSTRTVTLRLRPEASCPALLPGSFANVAAKGHGKNKEPLIPADADGAPVTSPDDGVTTSVGAAVEIPRLSVVDVRGVPTVFVATSEKGHFQARRVATRPSHGDLVIVESGLRPKEKVVSKGVILLKGELLGDSLGGH